MQASLLVPMAILLTSVWEDLRTRKVRNPVLIGLALVALTASIFFNGFSGFTNALIGIGAAFLLGLPLFLAKIMGGGDLKVLMVLGLASDGYTIVNTFFLALIWGAVLGLIHALVTGQLKNLLRNLYLLILLKGGLQPTQMHKIPYTVALLLGWLSYQASGGLLP